MSTELQNEQNEEKRQQNKLRYVELLSKLNIDLTELCQYLDSVDFWSCPASLQHFKTYPGGLVDWALDFYYELAQLCNAYFPGRYTEQDVIKVMLGKDLYRAEMYEPYIKNVKNQETGAWEDTVAWRMKEDRPVFGDLGFSSYMTVKKYVDLTDEQILAIVYSRQEYVNDIHDVCRQYPLVALTKMADMAAQYFNK